MLLVAQFVGDCGREGGREGGREEEKAERRQATDRPPIGRESERGARPTDTADGRKEREKAAVWQERAAQCYGLMYACQKQEGRREGRREAYAKGIVLNIVSKFISYRVPKAAISFIALGMLRGGGRNWWREHA